MDPPPQDLYLHQWVTLSLGLPYWWASLQALHYSRPMVHCMLASIAYWMGVRTMNPLFLTVLISTPIEPQNLNAN